MPNWKKVITSGSSAHLNQITASAFQFLGSGNAELEVQGHITASGDISSSGNLTSNLLLVGDSGGDSGAGAITMNPIVGSSTDLGIVVGSPSSNFKGRFGFVTDSGAGTGGTYFRVHNAAGNAIGYGQPGTLAHFAVSSSGYQDEKALVSVGRWPMAGQEAMLHVLNDISSSQLALSNDITAVSHITASGNISSSNGLLFSSASIKTGLDRLVAYDTSTGQFHITASSAFEGSGGGGGASALDDLSDVTYSSGDLTISSLDKLVVGDFEIDSSGDITLNADGGDISFKDNTDTLVEITNNADTGSIYVSGSIEFSPNDIRPSVSGSTLYNYSGTRAGTDNPTLEYNGIPVGPKQFEMITGAMVDDIGTQKIYLPLNNNFESTAASDEMGIVAPCSGSVKSFTCRIGGTLSGDVTFAVTFEKAFPGGTVTSPSVADSQDIDLAGTNDNDSFAVVFDNDAVVGPGEVMYFAIQGSADRSGTLNYFFTVVMEWDYSTLPNADTIYA